MTAFVLGGLLLLVGCGSTSATLGRWEGPAQPAAVSITPWSWVEQPGHLLRTSNYAIYTTIDDPEIHGYLAQIMQGGLAMYRQVGGDVPLSDRPLECFIFHYRSQWEQYTMRFGGPDAKIFLQIRSGGYTLGDRYVAYYNGRLSTYSVAAHEGWHQFAGRHFVGRLPPFLEEGTACLFESVTWDRGLPRWNLSVNAQRVQQLRTAVEQGQVVPLERLCTMHAGDVVGQGGQTIDGFYAQSWAFARFLYEAEGGRWRPALRRWIEETARGTVYDPTGSHQRAGRPWQRQAVAPMLEHYLGMDMAAISARYQAWVRHVAMDEFNQHWRGM